MKRSLSIPKEVLDQYRAIAAQTDRPVAYLLRQALTEHLKTYGDPCK